MTNLTISFNSLAKNNNGFFKSQKQAAFLLSQMDNLNGENTFKGTGTVTAGKYVTYRVFHCDDKGITKIIQHSETTGKNTQVWERLSDADYAVKRNRSIKALRNTARLDDIRKTVKKLEAIKESATDETVRLLTSGDMAALEAFAEKQLRIAKILDKLNNHYCKMLPA